MAVSGSRTWLPAPSYREHKLQWLTNTYHFFDRRALRLLGKHVVTLDPYSVYLR